MLSFVKLRNIVEDRDKGVNFEKTHLKIGMNGKTDEVDARKRNNDVYYLQIMRDFHRFPSLTLQWHFSFILCKIFIKFL